jgi:hypothetical protein
MLISHDKKFIFLKTKKTAGTSVEIFFQEYCLPPKMVGMTEANGDHTRTDAIVSEHGVVGYRGKRHPSKKLFNHMSAFEVRAYDPKAFEAYFKFTNIRNPFDKVVSFFWHLHRNDPNVKDADFSAVRDAFINWVAKSGVKPRDQDVYRIDGKFIADFYIRYENLQSDLEKVCNILDVTSRKLVWIFLKQLGFDFVPIFHGLQGRPAAQN